MRVLILLCLACGLAGAEPAARSAQGYRKGKPIRIHVVKIGWAEVEVKTARAFEKMRAAAERDGITLVIWSGFRSHDRQAALHARWRSGRGNLAARPGYSNHQSGRALDLQVTDPRVYAWLAAHAKRFGFKRTVRSEPWHWEYVGMPRRRR
jgi:LAS superfamily LD-carboxypeptidase LdcB